MHVIELHTENYKRLVAVDVAPKTAVVEIAGKNGAGKSSLLESMIVALCGEGSIPSKPIRKGEKAASIRVKLGGDKPTLIVTRTFAAKEDGGYTTKLVVEAEDGARYAKPQTMLDDLVGALAFDPLEFTRMKPGDQLEQLRAFVPGVNFAEIDAQNRGDFDRRTAVNREAKALRARLAAMQIPGDPRTERVDEAALVAELEQAGTVAADVERERARRQELMRVVRSAAGEADAARRRAAADRNEVEKLKQQIAMLEARAKAAESEAAERDEAARAQQVAVEALPPLAVAPDTTDIKQRIAQARARNREVDERERVISDRAALERQASAAEQQAATLTEYIATRNQAKADAVAAAKLPVEGLGFGDDTALLNGLPFDQASSAEQLRASVAIAAARNPKLRVMHVRDGSLLDDDSMDLLREFAEANGCQVWLEKVSSDSPVGIVIENGSVKERAEVAA